jgi:DNA (cytosine-5)-methyltransferase 1
MAGASRTIALSMGKSRSPTERAPATGQAHRPVAVDLFSGVGGFSLGFEQAGFDVPAALEWDPVHAVTHGFNFPHAEVLCRDASRVRPDDLRLAVDAGIVRHGRTWDGELDAVFGGPPCQGFSTGGKHAKRDVRNSFIFDFARLTIALQPKYFVFENVPPLRNQTDPDEPDQTLFESFTAQLEQGGFRILAPRVLNVADYGVPEDRKRLIVIGARHDVPLPAYPSPTVKPVPRVFRGESGRTLSGGFGGPQPGPTVDDALRGLPDPEQFAELWVGDEVAFNRPLPDLGTNDYASRLAEHARDSNDFSYLREWDTRLLTCSALTRHELGSVNRFAATRPGERESRSRFFRLDPRGLCPTLRAGTGYDRGSFMAPRPIHPRSPRVITVREAARLHSFPDWFRFHRTKWHGFRQIGNSLPPLFGRAIASALINALGRDPVLPRVTWSLGDVSSLALSTSEAAEALGVSDESLGLPSHKQRRRSSPHSSENWPGDSTRCMPSP